MERSAGDLQFHRSGERLITAGEDGVAAIYSVAWENFATIVQSSGHGDRLLQAVFGDGGTVVTSSRDTTAILWIHAATQSGAYAGTMRPWRTPLSARTGSWWQP